MPSRPRVAQSDPRVTAAARRLRTVDVADSDCLLRRALEALLEVGEADEAVFYRLAAGPDHPITARFMHIGSERARSSFERFVSKPPIADLRRIRSSAWEPSRIKAHELGDFLEAKVLHGDREWNESVFVADYLVPSGLVDQQRLLVAHGGHLIGWVGLFRRAGAPRFGGDDRRHLRPLVAPMAATVAAVARLDAIGPETPADLVVRPDGTVELASDDAKAWLAFRGFADALRHRVRDLDRGLAPDPVFVLDAAAEARALRLDGDAGVRYLLNVRPLRPLAIPALAIALTQAEREVADLALSGASAAEIAQVRGTSVGTVKNQLKRVYGRLGVSNRLELARALDRR